MIHAGPPGIDQLETIGYGMDVGAIIGAFKSLSDRRCRQTIVEAKPQQHFGQLGLCVWEHTLPILNPNHSAPVFYCFSVEALCLRSPGAGGSREERGFLIPTACPGFRTSAHGFTFDAHAPVWK